MILSEKEHRMRSLLETIAQNEGMSKKDIIARSYGYTPSNKTRANAYRMLDLLAKRGLATLKREGNCVTCWPTELGVLEIWSD